MQNGKTASRMGAVGAFLHRQPRRNNNSVSYILLFTSCVLLLLLHRKGPTAGCSQAASGSLDAHSASRQLQNAASQPVRLFIGVLSRSNNTEVRQAIRETWGKDRRLARVMFLVLRPKSQAAFRALREEAVQHEDVVVVSAHPEDYFQITYSTLELFKSAAWLGSELTHVLKTDEDCFIRVDRMLAALEAAPQQWMYGGYPFGMADLVSRDPKDPKGHFVPYSNWPSDKPLPPYAWGHGGVLTMDLVKHIAAGAAHMTMPPNNLLVLEDVSTGIWVKYVSQEQRQNVSYAKLPFERRICRPADALTHLEKDLWPSLAEAHRCLYSGACADKCTGADPDAKTNETDSSNNSGSSSSSSGGGDNLIGDSRISSESRSSSTGQPSAGTSNLGRATPTTTLV